jgi:general secretion pathway protein I
MIKGVKIAGFTLLEAIVALVIIASSGLALFSWVNTNLHSLARIQQAQQRHNAIRTALAFVETLNPAHTPSGEVRLGTMHIEWQSEALRPLHPGVTPLGGMSRYDVGLYEITLKVLQDNELSAEFKVRQSAYADARPPPLDW